MPYARYARRLGAVVGSLILLASLLSSPAQAATYYLAPTGADAQAGTADAPWLTFRAALARLQPGDTLTLLDGLYTSGATGLPRIDCSAGVQAGTEARPITLKAANERQAHLQGTGTSVISVYRCGYWVLEGLYASNVDTPAEGFDGSPIYISQSHHITTRRNLVYGDNPWFNSHCIMYETSTDSLAEENELYYCHRHGLAYVEGADRNTARRNYMHSRNHADMPGGFASDVPGDVRGDTGITCYPCNNLVAENNIVEDWDAGFDIQCKTNCGGNRYYGNMCLASRFCYLFAARTEESQGADIMPTNVVMEHNFGGGGDMNGSCGYFRSNKNLTITNQTCDGGTGGGLSVDQGAGGDGVNTFTASNILVRAYAQRGLDISAQASWGIDGVASLDNGGGDAPGLSDPHIRNVQTTLPALGACKVFSPLGSAATGAGVGEAPLGANILFRYQDGVLTTSPLWDPTTSRFPCGAIVAGVNDVPGSSCFDVHTRLNVNTNGCRLPTARPPLPAPRNLRLLGTP